MKTLKLISKAGNKNYFFGEIDSKGQELVNEFGTPEQLHDYFSKMSEGAYKYHINLCFCKQVINKEYRQSRTYYSRHQFDSLEFCIKIFNERAK